MAIEIKLPALVPSMTEAALARWTKREGESVKAGEVIAEVETDKAVVELEAPGDGVLGGILVADGTSGVAVDSLLGWLLQPGESVPKADAEAEAERSSVAVEAAPPSPSFSTSATPAHPKHPSPVGPASGRSDGQRIFASPLARRLAMGAGIALTEIAGSGPRGRIVRVDVEAALREPERSSAAGDAAASAVGVPVAGRVAGDRAEDLPHSSMRRVIAQRLTDAKQQIPHFYLTIDCQIDQLLALRSQINEIRPGTKVSVNDFIVRAAAVALQQVPAANASWSADHIRRWHDSDVAVAVATEGGLITPVIRAAQTRTVTAISEEIKQLAARGREGRLKPEEYQGGSFTITNLGMYGIREFAAIINPPQACILAVGSAEPRPVVANGELAVATMMTCTLSADHRVVDGVVGAEFLAAFRKLIESPLGMLA